MSDEPHGPQADMTALGPAGIAIAILAISIGREM